jgi:hypothetical protein
MQTTTRLVLVFVAVWNAGYGCGDERQRSVSARGAKADLIYGLDDRAEPDALDQTGIAAAVQRCVALASAEVTSAEDEDGGSNEDAGASGGDYGGWETAKRRFRLCPEERFADQPSVADCSGVLVAKDIVLTAGHCVPSHGDCALQRYLLGYANHARPASPSTVTSVECGKVLIREVGFLSDDSRIDYALVHLTSRAAVEPAVPRWLPAEPGEPVWSVGHPMGAPVKIDSGAVIVTVNDTGYELLADAYQGSSGSGLYDASGSLIGILTGGQRDFDWDDARSCQVSRVTNEAMPGSVERAMQIQVIMGRACYRLPDLALCDDYQRDVPGSGDDELPGTVGEEIVEGTETDDAASNEDEPDMVRSSEPSEERRTRIMGATRGCTTGCSVDPCMTASNASLATWSAFGIAAAIRARRRRMAY